MSDAERAESIQRLRSLESSTGDLAGRLELLTHAIEELGRLRQQTENANTQAELAVVTSLDATNEVSNHSTQLSALSRAAVTWTDLRRRVLQITILGLAGILLLSYTVVTGQQVFSKYCQFPGYLSAQRANTCNAVFIGDRLYQPGIQTTNKVQEIPPITQEDANNG